jgi:hypothetical protein
MQKRRYIEGGTGRVCFVRGDVVDRPPSEWVARDEAFYLSAPLAAEVARRGIVVGRCNEKPAPLTEARGESPKVSFG